MKRCPECRKDYLDDSLSYCLDDGAALVQGSVTDEPATALLRGEDKTWPLEPTSAHGTDGKEKLPSLRVMRYSILKWPAVFAVVAAMALTAYLFGRAGSFSGAGAIPRRANIAISTPLALGKYCPLGVGRTAVALSPDGSLLVYVGEKDGAPVLMARPLDSFEDRYFPGTEGAYAPFFSPDGRSIAFFANNELKRLSLDGGHPVTLCEARNAHGGSWGPDGTIIFADGEGGRLVRIPASGGQPVPAFRREGLSAAIWGFSSPEILPDGDTVIATFWNSPNPDKYKIGIFSLRSGGSRVLVEGGMNPRYLPTGHLVYSRSSTLIAAPFDAREGKITGPEVTLAENVRSEQWGSVQYTLGNDGTLIYVSGGPAWIGKPVWVNRGGAATPIAAAARSYKNLSISPDGQRLAVEVSEGSQDIYLYEFARGNLTRFTNTGENGSPRWFPDGTAVTFAHFSATGTDIVSKSIDSGAEKVLISVQTGGDMQSWSPDGKNLLFLQMTPDTGLDLWSKTGDQNASPWLVTPFREALAEFSRDGRYVAYVSDESGQYEVYVRPFSGETGKWQVSTAGGEEPIWSRDGRELFYRDGQKWMSVEVATSPQFKAGPPRLLFEGPYLNIRGTSYDVAADGRFLLLEENYKQSPTTQLSVVFNWSEEVKRRVPTGSH